MEPKLLSARGRNLMKMIEFDPEEQLLGEIRKHPFGLFIIFLTGGLVALALMLSLMVLPLLVTEDPIGLGLDIGSIRSILVGVGFLLTILAIVMTAVAAYLYQSNIVIITSEKITQLLYKTIFDRKISQLSIGDVQDVTINQTGVFARIFNYGTLTIETAGEQENYIFTFTPNPYETGKLIVGSHEENLKRYGN
jgi:hypothetical protein